MAGCGNGLPTAYPTAGTILVDGQPLAGVELLFYPETPPPSELAVPMPRAVTDASGRFEASTYAGQDGAPAGDYLVGAFLLTPMPEGADPEAFQQVDRLGGRYSAPKESGIAVTVEAGANDLGTIELKTKD